MDELALLDWKRRVAALYAEVRAAHEPAAAWRRWREVRDAMFAEHSQSPLPPAERRAFGGLPYFDYDPAMRALAEVARAEPRTLEVATSAEDPVVFTRFGLTRFELGGEPLELELYWLEGYGGGVFRPFADSTSGGETYAAGRYLLDTVKGADLGERRGRLVLDFNFAYNPSCSYEESWVCPLAPPPNRLELAIRAGERVAT